MVALATLTGPAASALLLLTALLRGACADTVTLSRCDGVAEFNRGRVLTTTRDDSATVLDLSRCGIKKLGRDDLNKTALPNLTHLSLYSNDLEHLDAAVFIPVSHVTKQLDLGSNKLRKAPVFGARSLFLRLAELDLSNNRINAITNRRTFSSCVLLESLLLNDNEIEYIQKDVFKQLPSLRIIDLRANKLVSIPETLFQVKSLAEIYVQNNVIEYVAPHAFRGTNLSALHISTNKLSFLPIDFASDLTALTGPGDWYYSFMFFNNPWHCACVLELLAEVKRLDVRYDAGPLDFTGKGPDCVFLGRQPCRRDAPSTLLPSSSSQVQ